MCQPGPCRSAEGSCPARDHRPRYRPRQARPYGSVFSSRTNLPDISATASSAAVASAMSPRTGSATATPPASRSARTPATTRPVTLTTVKPADSRLATAKNSIACARFHTDQAQATA